MRGVNGCFMLLHVSVVADQGKTEIVFQASCFAI